jgi:hypothetical protein
MMGWYWQGKPKNSDKNLCHVTLSSTNATCIDPGTNPGIRGERLATDSWATAWPFNNVDMSALKMNTACFSVGSCRRVYAASQPREAHQHRLHRLEKLRFRVVYLTDIKRFCFHGGLHVTSWSLICGTLRRLGGVVVSVLATRPKGCGFEPGQGDGFLRAIKIRSTPSSRMGSKAGRSRVVRFYDM